MDPGGEQERDSSRRPETTERRKEAVGSQKVHEKTMMGAERSGLTNPRGKRAERELKTSMARKRRTAIRATFTILSRQILR